MRHQEQVRLIGNVIADEDTAAFTSVLQRRRDILDLDHDAVLLPDMPAQRVAGISPVGAECPRYVMILNAKRIPSLSRPPSHSVEPDTTATG